MVGERRNKRMMLIEMKMETNECVGDVEEKKLMGRS
jgi:hypothetical protein